MRKTLLTGLVVGLLTIVMAVPALASNGNGKSSDSNGRPGSTLTITVLSTGLTYDSIITVDLPMKGPFQKLDGVTHTTAYGPGDPGYVGGRWWVDVDGDGEMNEGDAFFLCPLLGPGR
jgi:hypothetical protein